MNKNKRLDKIMNKEKECKNCMKLQQNYNSQLISNTVDYEKEMKELKQKLNKEVLTSKSYK